MKFFSVESDPAVDKMPSWYFDRQQIKNSPSFYDGIDTSTENRYRREGARFIIDAGTKMGLRWDTFATGVVYFHRFYMFHSFREFYRYVTAACCLFLAGKVEETPKKCRDIIKMAQNLLSASSFQKFGEDPREEVMTMERILLKTIKFDLQVDHPYTFLLKCAKNFKSDEDKVQNMAQMAWTFLNDSLCTTLCLQWEPEIVGVSLMYLASRFTKFEPTDWTGKSGSRSKWWEDFVEGTTIDLMEDVGHQMLDLYSHKNKKNVNVDSPPCSPAGGNKEDSTPPPPPPDRPPPKKMREEIKSESESSSKRISVEKEPKIVPKNETENHSSHGNQAEQMQGAPIPVAQHRTPSNSYVRNNNNSFKSAEKDTFSSYNPYVSSRMQSSSFMSQEGSQNIESILAGNGAPRQSASGAYAESHMPSPVLPGLADAGPYPSPGAVAPGSQYPYPPSQGQYAPPSIPPLHSSYPQPSNPPPGFEPYAPRPLSNPSYSQPSSYAPRTSLPSSHPSYAPPSLLPSHSYYPPSRLPPPPMMSNRLLESYPPENYPPPLFPDSHPEFGASRNYSNVAPEVRTSGRPDWNTNR